MEKRYLSKKVGEWYLEHRRDLPWRATNDPYKVWISEVILQQTRVSQGLSYYHDFVNTFPTVHDLARAGEDKVLRLWQGLGYYTRARNLHKCAKLVSTQYDGSFPRNFEGLRRLPGIGDYTAAAIASIAFDEPVAVVDGNVYRVLSRLYGIETPINSTKGKREFAELANSIIPARKPGTHNQALMEFGALQCTPGSPDCTHCIFKARCIARSRNLQGILPVKEQARRIRTRYFYYYVIQKGNTWLMKKRIDKDIWKGLYEFFLIESREPSDPKKLIQQDSFLKALRYEKKKLVVTNPYKHVLTHQVINCQFVHMTLVNENPQNGSQMRFYGRKSVDRLPKPQLVSRYLKESQFL